MATLAEYRETMRYLAKSEVVRERLDTFSSINGDAFYPLQWWPKDMRMLFWKKPIIDNDTFKFVLFMSGNWCSPALFARWIMLSQFWAAPATAEKRARQIDFIINNADTKRHTWFYYDLDHKKLLFQQDGAKFLQVDLIEIDIALCRWKTKTQEPPNIIKLMTNWDFHSNSTPPKLIDPPDPVVRKPISANQGLSAINATPGINKRRVKFWKHT